MRVVLDTNVIVSGLNFLGNEQRVLDLASRRSLCSGRSHRSFRREGPSRERVALDGKDYLVYQPLGQEGVDCTPELASGGCHREWRAPLHHVLQKRRLLRRVAGQLERPFAEHAVLILTQYRELFEFGLGRRAAPSGDSFQKAT